MHFDVYLLLNSQWKVQLRIVHIFWGDSAGKDPESDMQCGLMLYFSGY